MSKVIALHIIVQSLSDLQQVDLIHILWMFAEEKLPSDSILPIYIITQEEKVTR
jgi:hypothetical protein